MQLKSLTKDNLTAFDKKTKVSSKDKINDYLWKCEGVTPDIHELLSISDFSDLRNSKFSSMSSNN